MIAEEKVRGLLDVAARAILIDAVDLGAAIDVLKQVGRDYRRRVVRASDGAVAVDKG